MRDTTRGLGVIAAVLLLLFLGVALLYAYRSQAPAIPTVPYTIVLNEMQDGRVRSAEVEGGHVTVRLIDGTMQQTNTANNGDDFVRAVTDHNRSDPAHPVDVRYGPGGPSGIEFLFPVIVGLVPLLVLVALILLAAAAFARSRAPQRYEALSRLADLRDRGVLTEEEFQREKRRLL